MSKLQCDQSSHSDITMDITLPVHMFVRLPVDSAISGTLSRAY